MSAQSYLILLWPQALKPCQAPLSMGFPRQEYWTGLSFPSPGDLPNPGIKSASPALLLLLLLLSHFSHVRLCATPPGSPGPGILQARTLEWVAISFSNTWKWKVKVKSLSRVWLLATPWTAACKAPPSMGFARQEDWSGVPLPPPLLHCKWVFYCLCHQGSPKRKCYLPSCVQLFATPCTVAHQAPLSFYGLSNFPLFSLWTYSAGES